LVGAAKTVAVMDRTSHFPFFEDPDGFTAAVAQLIK
jgi:hypothetical protein